MKFQLSIVKTWAPEKDLSEQRAVSSTPTDQGKEGSRTVPFLKQTGPTCVRLLVPSVRGGFQPTDYFTELLDRLEAVEGFDDTIQIQADVFMNHNVAESGEARQFFNQGRRKGSVVGKASDRSGIIFEGESPSRAELPRDIDDELAYGQ